MDEHQQELTYGRNKDMSIFVSSQLCTCFNPTVFVCMLLMTHNIPIYYNLKLHVSEIQNLYAHPY
jgi:hypothetical protein